MKFSECWPFEFSASSTWNSTKFSAKFFGVHARYSLEHVDSSFTQEFTSDNVDIEFNIMSCHKFRLR